MAANGRPREAGTQVPGANGRPARGQRREAAGSRPLPPARLISSSARRSGSQHFRRSAYEVTGSHTRPRQRRVDPSERCPYRFDEPRGGCCCAVSRRAVPWKVGRGGSARPPGGERMTSLPRSTTRTFGPSLELRQQLLDHRRGDPDDRLGAADAHLRPGRGGGRHPQPLHRRVRLPDPAGVLRARPGPDPVRHVAPRRRLLLAAGLPDAELDTYPKLDFNDPQLRKVATIVIILTAVNGVILGVGVVHGRRAHGDGGVLRHLCHKVMQPEHTAYQNSAALAGGVRAVPHRPRRLVVRALQARRPAPGVEDRR